MQPPQSSVGDVTPERPKALWCRSIDPSRPSPSCWLRSKVASAACFPAVLIVDGNDEGRFQAYRPYYHAYLLQKGPRLMGLAASKKCRETSRMVVAAPAMQTRLPALWLCSILTRSE